MTNTERRDSVTERRRRSTPALSGYFLLGRRRALRRESDAQVNYYVDRPAEQAALTAVLLLSLSLLDALLSLRLFHLGTSHELNPLLAITLRHGAGLFLLSKVALTASATLVLLLHWNFVLFGRVALAGVGRLLVGLYVGLIVYEIVLMVRS